MRAVRISCSRRFRHTGGIKGSPLQGVIAGYSDPVPYNMYTAIVGKKHQCLRERPKGGLGIHWNFSHWPRGNVQICIFAQGEFVFPLRGPISVALLFLSHVIELELVSVAKRTLSPHVCRERKRATSRYIVISH